MKLVRRDGRLVEIRLRTLGQHRWAEYVERLGSFTGIPLKDGQGPREVLGWLERAAYAIALQEGGQPVPGELAAEVAALALVAGPHLRRSR